MKTTTLFRTMLIAALMSLTIIVNAQDRIYLGARIPQMSNSDRSQIGAESNAQNARGQLIFNTEAAALQYWDGTKWVLVTANTDENTTYTAGYALTLNGTEFNVNMITIADSLVLNETFISNIANNSEFISILNQVLDDNDTQYSADEVTINKSVNNVFSVNVANVANNITFVEELTTNQTFIEAIEGIDTDTQYGAGFGLNLNGTEFSTDIVAIGDSLVLNETFVENLVEEIAYNVTQEFTDSIMANVTVTGERGIEIEGSGTSNITVKLPEGQSNGQILTWDNSQSKWQAANQVSSVKQVTIPVENGTFDTKNLIFYGTTSAATSALKVVSVEPVFSNLAMRRNFLKIDASVQVVGNAAEWTIGIENRNISSANQQTLQSVIISYICDDIAALTNAAQGITEISGY